MAAIASCNSSDAQTQMGADSEHVIDSGDWQRRSGKLLGDQGSGDLADTDTGVRAGKLGHNSKLRSTRSYLDGNAGKSTGKEPRDVPRAHPRRQVRLTGRHRNDASVSVQRGRGVYHRAVDSD